MNWRLDDIPVYELTETTVSAADFNRVQLAFHRIEQTLHIPLTGLRSLELILEREAWIVVDHDANDLPILAWTDFQSGHRSSLHQPVPCTLKTYHMHARVILEQVHDFMARELAARIAERQKACELENVVPLIPPRKRP
ncbi:MAG: hypothetical protein RRB22_00465 [Gammaproteobacteria bacterium]|nr:hypothetical protein [Gammaproteobacteria bacterium]